MPRDGLQCQLERQFLTSEGSLDDLDDVNILQQLSALSADDCESIVTQLLTYFDAYVSQLQHRVSYVQCSYKKMIYTVGHKKTCHFIFSITLANIDGFS